MNIFILEKIILKAWKTFALRFAQEPTYEVTTLFKNSFDRQIVLLIKLLKGIRL